MSVSIYLLINYNILLYLNKVSYDNFTIKTLEIILIHPHWNSLKLVKLLLNCCLLNYNKQNQEIRKRMFCICGVPSHEVILIAKPILTYRLVPTIELFNNNLGIQVIVNHRVLTANRGIGLYFACSNCRRTREFPVSQ